MRRVHDYGLTNLKGFSEIPDEAIDNKIKDYIAKHGSTTGQSFINGQLRSLGLHVKSRRISKVGLVQPVFLPQGSYTQFQG